jgi:hypothetical protein
MSQIQHLIGIINVITQVMRMIKKMIYASMGVAGFVGFLSILDMSIKIPFGGYSLTLDIIYLVTSAILGYLSWDAYRDNC